MAQKSENSRKIAAKISEGMQGNGIFRNSYKIDAVRVRVAQNVIVVWHSGVKQTNFSISDDGNRCDT